MLKLLEEVSVASWSRHSWPLIRVSFGHLLDGAIVELGWLIRMGKLSGVWQTRLIREIEDGGV